MIPRRFDAIAIKKYCLEVFQVKAPLTDVNLVLDIHIYKTIQQDANQSGYFNTVHLPLTLTGANVMDSHAASRKQYSTTRPNLNYLRICPSRNSWHFCT